MIGALGLVQGAYGLWAYWEARTETLVVKGEAVAQGIADDSLVRALMTSGAPIAGKLRERLVKAPEAVAVIALDADGNVLAAEGHAASATAATDTTSGGAQPEAKDGGAATDDVGASLMNEVKAAKQASPLGRVAGADRAGSEHGGPRPSDTPSGTPSGTAASSLRQPAGWLADIEILAGMPVLVTTVPVIDEVVEGGGRVDELGNPVDAPTQITKRTVGYIVVALDESGLGAAMRRQGLLVVLLGGVALIGASALIGSVFRSVFVRVDRMRAAADKLAGGDLRDEVDDGIGDEIGAISQAVERVRMRWSDIINEIRAVATGVRQATDRIRDESGHVARGSDEQLAAVHDTQRRVEEILDQNRRVASQIDEMANLCRRTQLALTRAGEASQQVAMQMDEMKSSLDDNDAQKTALLRSSAAIGEALAELSRAVRSSEMAARDVAASAEQATVTGNAIAGNAREAVLRSGQALETLSRQRVASDALELTARTTGGATAALRDGMGEVLSLAERIGDIADLTSMLSLNASIIAAQAGDRALGFGTIADEIRSLAARARDVASNIGARTEQARHQLDTVGEAMEGLVSQAVSARDISAETSRAVGDVLNSMNAALSDVDGLAELLGDAHSKSGAAVDSVNGMVRQTKRIQDALDGQQQAQVRLDVSFREMARHAVQVRDTSVQQVAATSTMRSSMDALVDATGVLVESAQRQTARAERIAAEVGAVRDVASRHGQTVSAIGASVTDLAGQSDALQRVIASLRTG